MTLRDDSGEAALHRLLQSLPGPARRFYHWLCQERLVWLRVPLALLFIGSGFLGFLPVLGFWMLPIGVLLLSEDVPVLRRPTLQALRSVQGWWDRLRARRGRAP